MIHPGGRPPARRPCITETPSRQGIPRLSSVLPALSRFELGVPELATFEKPVVLGADHRRVVLHLRISFSTHADLLRFELGQDLLLHPAKLVVGLEPASGVRSIAGAR